MVAQHPVVPPGTFTRYANAAGAIVEAPPADRRIVIDHIAMSCVAGAAAGGLRIRSTTTTANIYAGVSVAANLSGAQQVDGPIGCTAGEGLTIAQSTGTNVTGIEVTIVGRFLSFDQIADNSAPARSGALYSGAD